MVYLRCSLSPHSLELRLYNKVSVTPGGALALCKLVQSRLGRWVRLVAVCRPQKLRSEGWTLGDTTVTELDDMRDRKEADHVHQQLKSKSCGQPETNTGSDTVSIFKVPRSLSLPSQSVA